MIDNSLWDATIDSVYRKGCIEGGKFIANRLIELLTNKSYDYESYDPVASDWFREAVRLIEEESKTYLCERHYYAMDGLCQYCGFDSALIKGENE